MPDHGSIEERILLYVPRAESALHASSSMRTDSSSCIRNAAPKIRSAAGTYADAIGSLTGGGKRASVRSSVPDMLKMFPGWGVTSSSTLTNVSPPGSRPLRPGGR